MNDIDIEILALPAMRYALGRMTYVTADVSRSIIRNAEKLPAHTRNKMRQEIAFAINNDEAGMDMDVKEWLKAYDALEVKYD